MTLMSFISSLLKMTCPLTCRVSELITIPLQTVPFFNLTVTFWYPIPDSGKFTILSIHFWESQSCITFPPLLIGYYQFHVYFTKRNLILQGKHYPLKMIY